MRHRSYPFSTSASSAAPTVEPHELRHRDPVAERKGADQKGAQVAAGALDDGQGFRHGELQQWIAPLGVQAPGHHLDRLEREVERRVATGDALCLHLRSETGDVVPCLRLARGPGVVAAVFRIGNVLVGARRQRHDQALLQVIDDPDDDAGRERPIEDVAVLPQPEASQGYETDRRQQQRHGEENQPRIAPRFFRLRHGLTPVAPVPRSRSFAR